MLKQVNSDIVNLFTVDIEDYFQVSAFEHYVQRKEWGRFECRVVPNTHRILRLLARYNVRGTFFMLGWIAQHYPHLVQDIKRDGHEIAAHGYWHRLIYDQTPEDFRADLRQARDVIQDITATSVNAYRAPSFSITTQSLWALEILSEEGFTVDSSIFPIHHDRYGIADADPRIRQIATGAGTIWEVPPSVSRFAGMNMPVGGGYFRLYPFFVTCYLLRRINHLTKQPFTIYVHPWELDPDQPRISIRSRTSRFRHYVNLHKTERKLERLLREFRFGPIADVITSLALQKDQAVAELSPVN
jgi:polysaccharide deacetylase family protein (PEP-CTERM system associated)